MNKYKQITACSAGIDPIYIEGLREHGLNYLQTHDSNAVGGQCAHCHTIVWVNDRTHPITSERKPDDIADSGEFYKKYYLDKISRFLQSLPPCPSCSGQTYDRFITNYSDARFEDGTPWDNNDPNVKLDHIDPGTINVWWLD